MGKNKGISSLIILTILGAVILGIIIASKNQTSNQKLHISSPSPSGQELNTFRSSSVMKFSISVPKDFQVEERFGAVTISTPTGKITIDQNGTNFDNLKDYFQNSGNNLETRLKNKREQIINGLDSISGNIESEKIYFIYSENTVYMLSTEMTALSSDLDQIAQSFRYIP